MESAPPYSPFCVPFNPKPLHSPRKLRVICVGAGFAGLTLAYKLLHELNLPDTIDFTVYERQKSVGGTWLANQYPGLTCDVPVHVYTLPWAPKHDWTSFMASGEEIRRYVEDVSEKFQLARCIQFNTVLKSAVWHEADAQWALTIERDGKAEDHRCDILVGAVGTQNTPLSPEIPGVQSFNGPVVHTGHWDTSVDYSNKRIAVIGNGSSGIQAFGALQPFAAHITHYIRTPTWISMNYLAQFTKDGHNFKYSPEEKQAFQNPTDLFAYRQKLESTSNGIFKNLVYDETCQDVKKNFRATTEKVMRERIAPELHARLIPSYQPWCRRLTPGDDYLSALQAPNASLIDTPIASITPTSIITADGQSQPTDIIITASGFTNTRVPPWTMHGLSGISLSALWSHDTSGYLSVCAPQMPNYFSLGCGPNFTIANGSVLSAFGFVADYILLWLLKMSREDIRSICPKDDVVEAYNIYIQEVLRRTAWNGECSSWYRKGRRDAYRTGITAIYPGSMNHFKAMLEGVRGEDFEIEYGSRNRWRFFGNGLTGLDMQDGADLAWYLKSTMKLENMM